jgi:hypothetical protein
MLALCLVAANFDDADAALAFPLPWAVNEASC